jgi:hypothetical protein
MLALDAEAFILQLRAHCKFNVHPASKKDKPTTKKTHSLKEEMGFFRSLKLLYQNGMSSSISEKFGAGFGCGRAAGAGGAWRGACWRGCCGAE